MSQRMSTSPGLLCVTSVLMAAGFLPGGLRELRKEGEIGKKAPETVDRDEHNLDDYVLPRWGGYLAKSIKPADVEAWFTVLASMPQGKRKKPLKWPTIDKINLVMS